MQDKHPEEQEGMLQEEENTMEWRPQDADREMVKRQIRDRVRSAKVADNAVFIPARPEPKVYDDGEDGGRLHEGQYAEHGAGFIY